MTDLIASFASLIEAIALLLMAIFLLSHGRSIASSINRLAHTFMLLALTKDRDHLSLAVRFLERVATTGPVRDDVDPLQPR